MKEFKGIIRKNINISVKEMIELVKNYKIILLSDYIKVGESNYRKF